MDKTLKVKVDAIRNDFIRSLPKRIEKILRLSNKLLETHWDPIVARDLRYEVHNLRGFSGTHGLVVINALAGKTENLIESLRENNKVLNSKEKTELNSLIQELVSKMQAIHIDLSEDQPNKFEHAELESDSPLIIVVDDDRNFCESICLHLSDLGYRTKYIYDLEDLKQSINTYNPSAILMDIMFNGDRDAGTATISKMKEQEEIPCPIIYMSARDDIDARVSAVRSGGVAFINKNFSLGDLKNTLDLIVPLQKNAALKVLIVDDDKTSAEYCKAILEHAKINAFCLTNARDIFEYIINYDPDVILLDMYMPDIDGLEMACVIRQHQAFSFIPIVIMSGETDINKQFIMRRAGADDFILKPFKPRHLVDTILNRIQRSKHTKQLIYTDGLTSLMIFPKIKEQVLNLIESCLRYNLDLSIALIDLDFFKNVNDKYGHLIGDQILCRFADFLLSRVRKSDLVTRYGGEEFAIVFPYTNGENTVRALNSIREEFAQSIQHSNTEDFQITFSAGVAELSPIHQDLESLLSAADVALYDAKENGRNGIKMAD